MGASRLSRPCCTSARAAPAATSFEMEPAENSVAGVAGVRAVVSAQP